jgi:hypothetical protein
VFSGKSYGPFTAENLVPLGGNQYSVTLRMEDPEQIRRTFKDMRVSIKVSFNQNSE